MAVSKPDFPILCKTCLGHFPSIVMIKEKYAKQCIACVRLYTVFGWYLGTRTHYKNTKICQMCSKIKNVCQSCLQGLEYGLPIQVKDAALKIQNDLPRNKVIEKNYTQSQESQALKSLGTSGLHRRLTRTTPSYKRNRPNVCIFWAKGQCIRGGTCPYRHEKPTDPDDLLADQNIKDRYNGVNNPVAEKFLRPAVAMSALPQPEDGTVPASSHPFPLKNPPPPNVSRSLRDFFTSQHYCGAPAGSTCCMPTKALPLRAPAPLPLPQHHRLDPVRLGDHAYASTPQS